jgi:predicted RNase H-like HicB family nuclease
VPLDADDTHVIITVVAYNIETVKTLTELTGRQIRYWDTTGLVAPSIQPAKGRGSRRLYSFENLVELRTIARLLIAGVSLQRVRKVVEYIHKVRDVTRPLASLRFLVDGDGVFISSDDEQGWADALSGGQVLLIVPVDQVWKDTEAKLRDIGEPITGKVKAAGRDYNVRFEPDLEDGGWIVECPDIPGCVSQGDNMTEARRMIRDAIEAMLAESDAEGKKARRAK